MEKATKIVRLEAKNYKRLRAVSIVPDGPSVVIAGRNAQGKSSVLDAIWAALGGKKAIPSRPVRDGEKQAIIRLELDNGIIVTRTIKADGGGALKVESADGAQFKSPQALLDGLVASLSFDPFAFTRLDAKKQLAELQRLAGLDFTAADAKRAALYEERTIVGREGKRIAGAVESTPKFDDAPAEEVSVAALAEELRAGEEALRCAERYEAVASSRSSMASSKRAEADELRRRAAMLETDALSLDEQARAARESADSARANVPDIDAIRTRLAGAEDTNRKVRANRERAKHEAELEAERARYADLTAQIDALDEAKRTAIAGAKFPLEGLAVDDHGVTLGGLPFDQASSAEQLRASVAIGLAMNPKLRVLLVREGAFLDRDSLRLLGEIAAENNAQVWVERVDVTDGVGVVIEDGGVVGAEEAEAAE